MPRDAVDGVRRDVFERVCALKPAFIRWPGGNVAQDYHWQWGVGPRDSRAVWTNLSWKNEMEPSDFGTDEYLRFCKNTGARPTIVINIEGRGATVAEAAAWVEYCNGLATSKFVQCVPPADTPSPTRSITGSWAMRSGRLGARPLRCPDLRPQPLALSGGDEGR